jgi:hypothetical protein
MKILRNLAHKVQRKLSRKPDLDSELYQPYARVFSLFSSSPPPPRKHTEEEEWERIKELKKRKNNQRRK